jgi:hypothetical protein
LSANKVYFCSTHQDKAKPYVTALGNAGWLMRHRVPMARFMLLDADTGAYADRIDKAWVRNRCPSFVYPHAGPPSLLGDYEGRSATKRLQARFVSASGHVEVMRAYGYRGKVEVVGWAWCDLSRFRPKAKLRRVLFMPIHPNSNGFLSERDRVLNAAAFDRCKTICEEAEARLIVRHIRSLKDNGLVDGDGRVIYKQGQPSIAEALAEIDNADLVVAHHTPAYLAVARGVPTLMIGEREQPLIGGRQETLAYAIHWHDYVELMAYPLDVLESDDPAELAREAALDDCTIREWRSRMIGDQFEGAAFVRKLESHL